MHGKTINLEDRLVIISSDSTPSRKMAEDLGRGLSLDHTMGDSIILLESRRKAFAGGEQTFELVDPSGALDASEIDNMIQNWATYFVSKLENPVLDRPFEYLRDILVETLVWLRVF